MKATARQGKREIMNKLHKTNDGPYRNRTRFGMNKNGLLVCNVLRGLFIDKAEK